MGKVKTHKASAKRFSVTASGKVKMGHCHHRHTQVLRPLRERDTFVRAQFLATQ